MPLGWDSDLSSILLLLHLLPPTSRGQKKTTKISSAQATSRLVRYLKVCKSSYTKNPLIDVGILRQFCSVYLQKCDQDVIVIYVS